MTQNVPATGMGTSADYVMALERRIIQLENQIQQFEKQLSQQQTNITVVGNKLPNSNLLSPSFLSRAFAVWGHTVAAQIMIAVPLYCLLIIFGLMLDY